MADGNYPLSSPDPSQGYGGAMPALLAAPKRPFVVPAQAQTPQSAQQQMVALLANGTPIGTAQAAAQSQAAQNMLGTIQQNGMTNSRTPGALLANLLADGIAQHTATKNQKAMLQAYASDYAAARNNQLASIGLGPDGKPLPPAGQSPASVAPATPAPSPLPSAQPGAAPTPTDGGSVEDDVRAAIAQAQQNQGGQAQAATDPLSSVTGSDPKTSDAGGPLMLGRGGYDTDAVGGQDNGSGSADPSQKAGIMAAMLMGQAPAQQGAVSASLNGLNLPFALGNGGPQAAGAPNQMAQAAAQQAAPPTNQQGPPGFPGAAGPATGDAGRVGPQPSADDRDALIRMVYGEARGEPPKAQAATAAVAVNRSILSGQPISAVVNAPGQFEGMKVGAQLDPNSPAYQQIASRIVDPILSGQVADPSGGATHFYSPGAQSALGRSKPSWDDGTGAQIGNQLFFRLPYAGQSATAPVPGGVQPYLVAANGPTPPPPTQQAQPQGQPGAPPQVQYGPGPSDREQATLQLLARTPGAQAQQAFQELTSSIRQRMLTPVEMDARYDPQTGATTFVPKTPGYGQEVYQGPPQGWRPPLASGQMYGQNGAAQAIPGTAARPMTPQERSYYGISPSDRNAYEITPDGKVTKAAEATYQPLPGSARAQYGIAPSDRSTYAIGPDGKPVQVAADPFGPDKQVQYASTFMGLPQVKDYAQLRQFHDAAQLAAQQQGGPADLQILDMALKSNNPTLGIRPNQVEQMMSELGLPNQFKGELQALVQNGGKLSPQARSAMMNVIDNQMRASWQAVQPLMTKASRDAQKFGLSTEDLIPGLTPPPPRGSSGPGFGPAPGSTVDPAAAIAAGRAAIQRGAPRAAVIQRLQAAGINPAGAL